MSLSRCEFYPSTACPGLGAGTEASDECDAVVECQSGKRRGTRGRRAACGTWYQGPRPSSGSHSVNSTRLEKYFCPQHATDCSPPTANQSRPPNSRREDFFRSFQATLILGSFCFPFPFRPGPPAVKLLPSPPTKTARNRYLSSPRNSPKSAPLKKNHPPQNPTHFRDLDQLRFHERTSSIPSIDPHQQNFGVLRMHREEESI